MPTLKQWAESHEPGAVSRVVNRLERFATNTVDEATSAAANSLLEMLKQVEPKK